MIATYRLFTLFAASIAVCLYIQVIGFDFVWDDNIFLVDSARLRSADWSGIFSEAFFLSGHYYRPLVLSMYVADVRFSDLSAGWMHGVNLALFFSNVILVWVIAKQVAKRLVFENKRASDVVPYAAASVYLCHPANIEAAAWISGRFDLMVTLFMLAAMVMCASHVRSYVKYPAVFFLYLSACLSKEMAVTFPLVLFIYQAILYKDYSGGGVSSFRRILLENIPVYTAVMGAGVVYLCLRVYALGSLLTGADHYYLGTWLQHVLLVAKAFGMYLFSTILPFAYSAPIHKDYFPIELSDRLAWVSLLTLLVSISYAFYRLRKSPIISLLYIAFVVSLLPVLHIKPIPIDENIINERFLTFPLVFFSILVVVVTLKLIVEPVLTSFGKSVAMLLAVIWSLSCVVVLYSQIPLWKNNRVFWEWAREKAPDSVAANTNLAVVLSKLGDNEKAERLALIANGLQEGRNAASIVLSGVYMNQGKFDAAAKEVEKALSSPRHIPAIKLKELVNQLGLVKLRQGQYELAIEIFMDILREDPYYYQSMVNLGSALHCSGSAKEGDAYWDRSIGLMPPDRQKKYKEWFENLRQNGLKCGNDL